MNAPWRFIRISAFGIPSGKWFIRLSSPIRLKRAKTDPQQGVSMIVHCQLLECHFVYRIIFHKQKYLGPYPKKAQLTAAYKGTFWRGRRRLINRVWILRGTAFEMEWKWNGINDSTRPAFVSFATAGKWVGEIRHGKEMRPIEMDLFLGIEFLLL